MITRRRFGLLSASALGLSAFGPPVFPAVRAHAAPTPAHGGTITHLSLVEPNILVDILRTARGGVNGRVVEGLIKWDLDLKPQPSLATSWDISADGLIYTFNLRPGVKWHDGELFGAPDVAFSIQTLKEIHPRLRGTFQNVEKVDVIDPLTVRIVLAKPAPYLLTALAATGTPIIPRHIYEGTDVPNNPNNTAPIGTGPFIFREWVRGSHYVLERNPDYWDAPKPYLDRIIVRFIKDQAAAAAAFENGEVDIGGQTPVSYADVDRLAGLDHLDVDTRGYDFGGAFNQLVFNLENPNLKKLGVRQAIAHAVDLQGIVNIAWYGYAVVSPSPIGPTMAHFHDPGIKPYAFDTAKAETLLDEAGLGRGADGIRFKLRAVYAPTAANVQRTAFFVKDALARVGIEVEIAQFDLPTYIGQVYKERNFDLDFTTLYTGFDPTDGIQRVYWSKNIKPGLPWSNASLYSNPRVDELLETAAVETDFDKRKALYTEFQNIVHRELPVLNLVQFQSITIVNTRLKDYLVTADGIDGDFSEAKVAK